MSEETLSVPTEIVIPNLDREEVASRSDGIPFIEYEAYGTYKLQLVQFKADPGKKNNPHFRADCIVLESNNVAYPAGREVSIHFPTGRQGTATDPGKKERDDERVARFVCACFRKPYSSIKAKTFNATEHMKALLKAGKLPPEKRAFSFLFVREQGNTSKIYDKKADKVVEVTYPRDRFEAIAA